MGPVKVQAVAAYNINKDFHKKSENWVGYIVTLSNGTRVYHSGDSDATPEMKAVKTDIAMLPCGGTYTMTAAEVAGRQTPSSRPFSSRCTGATSSARRRMPTRWRRRSPRARRSEAGRSRRREAAEES